MWNRTLWQIQVAKLRSVFTVRYARVGLGRSQRQNILCQQRAEWSNRQERTPRHATILLLPDAAGRCVNHRLPLAASECFAKFRHISKHAIDAIAAWRMRIHLRAKPGS